MSLIAVFICLLITTHLSCFSAPSESISVAEVASPTNSEYQELAAAYSAEHKGIAMLVMVEGDIVFDDYPNRGSPYHAHKLASGTKSFAGTLAVAAAADDGLLTIDEKVSDTITEWAGDPRKCPESQSISF